MAADLPTIGSRLRVHPRHTTLNVTVCLQTGAFFDGVLIFQVIEQICCACIQVPNTRRHSHPWGLDVWITAEHHRLLCRTFIKPFFGNCTHRSFTSLWDPHGAINQLVVSMVQFYLTPYSCILVQGTAKGLRYG